MWDYVPTRLTFCKRRGRSAGVGFHQDGGDHVHPSPRDRKSSTCIISTLSDRDRIAHHSPRGATRSTRSSSFQMQRDCDQTATMWLHPRVAIFRDSSNRKALRGSRLWSSSNGWHRVSSTRLDLHRTDDERGSWSRDRDRPNLPDQIRRQRLCWTHDSGSRSRFDRGPIAPRSGQIHHQIWSYDASRWWATITVRSWPSIPPHDRIKRLEFSGQNSF